MASSERQRETERFIVDLVADQAHDIARLVAEKFGITRQAVGIHLRRMVQRGELLAEGQTRKRRYRLPVLSESSEVFQVHAGFSEDRVWSQFVAPSLSDVPPNVRDICHYGITEMVNNVIDHSGSTETLVGIRRNAARLELTVLDRGIGIFRKIREAYGLEDDRHAILELVKGKLTTDPERHTGEGIFFTSRMFEDFSILASGLFLWHGRDQQDWLIESRGSSPGTLVGMSIRPASNHTTKEVFDRYATEQDDYAFSRTHVVVNLVRSGGEKLISRSQAKRLVARLELFREIVLDFRGVESIGPAFADEIFRVFRKAHPGSRLTPINLSEDVKRMIGRALTEHQA